MKKIFQAVVVAAAVLAIPTMSLAAQAKPAATASAPAKAAVRSARGVVKSIDASSLVLTEKAGRKKSHEVRFMLDNATRKNGSVAVGSTVQVTYHNHAKKHVATEVRPAGKKS